MTQTKSYSVYPFSAIVGQDRLKQALILNAINPRIGGVLIRGEKGTAKSTAVRGLARLLPPITVVKGCVHHCHPDHPAGLCSICGLHRPPGEPLPIHVQPTHLIELPVSASEDRVVGSLDLEHAITEGQRRFEPGLLAHANRGLLYVDEVNLLDDHLVDLLLDAAAMGINTVEREGVSVTHPSQFILVGTMNPEEGELRPQLLDRFGLAVEIRGLDEVASRALVIERRMAYDADPEQFIASWQNEEQKQANRIIRARTLLPTIRVTKTNIRTVASLSLELQVDGHRADLTILETARTYAAWSGRKTISVQDIQIAAELSLPHRMRRQPFQQVETNGSHIQAALERTQQQTQTRSTEQSTQQKKNVKNDDTITEAAPHAEWDGAQVSMKTSTPSTNGTRANQTRDDSSASDKVYESGDIFRPKKLDGQTDYRQRRASGRRSRTCSSRRQGRYITSRKTRPVNDLAFDATLRAAAPYQKKRRNGEVGQDAHPKLAHERTDMLCSRTEMGLDTSTGTAYNEARSQPKIIIYRDDLRQKVRIRRTRNAVCFVVDASWSMAAEERMYATKATILSLLRDAYQRRDYVGLVSFQRTYATVLLPLTNSVELAQRCLHTMPVGGKTPLARGLLTGFDLLERARKQDPEVIPLLVILTDGQANVAMTQLPPQQEAYRVAEYIAAKKIRAVVIDTEYTSSEQGPSSMISAHASRAHMKFSQMEQGLARHLALHLQAHYYRLEDLDERSLAQTVRTEMYSEDSVSVGGTRNG